MKKDGEKKQMNIPIEGIGLDRSYIGAFETDDKTYYRILDGNVHILRAEKYQDMICISKNKLRRLAQLECEKLHFTVVNFTPKPWSAVKKERFDAIIKFHDFLVKREQIHFPGAKLGDLQYGVRLKEWEIIDAKQTMLNLP